MNASIQRQPPVETARAVSDYHYRHRAGALRWCAIPAYRVVFWCSLRYALPGMYGGGPLDARTCRAYWIGRARPDDSSLGATLDTWYEKLSQQLRSDFRIHKRRLPKVYVVIVCEPPGLAEVVRSLGLEVRYTLQAGAKADYFWHERALMTTWPGTAEDLHVFLVHLMCEALFHSDLGASWPDTWAIHGYACLQMVLQCAPDQVISVPRLSHFLTAIDEGRVMTLGQLIASECAEPYYGPRAYNEQLYHFFLWLHRQRNYLPQVWELLRDWIARRLTAPNELAHELERVFGASIEEIDKTFVAWCRQELANLETGSRNGHAGSP